MATTELIDFDLLNGLKVDIVHRVTELTDLETARKIVVLLDGDQPKKPYVLTPDDEAALERGRKDYAEGRWTSHEDFMAELDRWRKDKQKQ